MKRTLALLAAAVVSACSDSGGDTPSPAEPNDTFETASPIAIGTTVVGTMASGRNPDTMVDGDRDVYRFEVPAGGATVRFQTFDRNGTECDPVNEAVDPLIEVHDATRALLATDDDSGAAPWCEDLTVTLPAGTAYVLVSGWDPTPFDYTLKTTIVP